MSWLSTRELSGSRRCVVGRDMHTGGFFCGFCAYGGFPRSGDDKREGQRHSARENPKKRSPIIVGNLKFAAMVGSRVCFLHVCMRLRPWCVESVIAPSPRPFLAFGDVVMIYGHDDEKNGALRTCNMQTEAERIDRKARTQYHKARKFFQSTVISSVLYFICFYVLRGVEVVIFSDQLFHSALTCYELAKVFRISAQLYQAGTWASIHALFGLCHDSNSPKPIAEAEHMRRHSSSMAWTLCVISRPMTWS